MDEHKKNLTYQASPVIFENARALKHAATEAEQALWQELRNRKCNGYKFRRQHPVNRFVADFYCHELKLVIEVDGGIHNDITTKERDDGRTVVMNELELTVMRFSNDDVFNKMEWVLEEIKRYADNYGE